MEDTSPSSPSLPSAPSVEASSPSAALKLPIVQALNTTRTTQGSTYYFDRSDDRALEYLHDAATLGASRIQRRRGRGSPGDGLLLGAYKEKYQGHTIELRHRSHRLIGLRVAREQRKEQEAIEVGGACRPSVPPFLLPSLPSCLLPACLPAFLLHLCRSAGISRSIR